MRKYYQLSDSQKQIIKMEQFVGDSIANIPFTFVSAEFDNINAIRSALNNVIKNHDSLRIRLKSENDSYVEYVEEYSEHQFEYKSFKDEDEITSWAKEQARTVIALDGDLFRFTIVSFGDKFGWFGILHHVIADSWSIRLMVYEFEKAYKAYINNTEYSSELCSYIDLIKEQPEIREKDVMFWKEQLEECNERVTVTENEKITFAAKRMVMPVENSRKEKIHEYCKNNGISEFVFFTFLMSAYLKTVKDKDNFYLGTMIYNRGTKQEKKSMGMFVTTNPMYISLDNNQSCVAAMHQIATNVTKAIMHRKFTYTKVSEMFSSQFENKRLPLYDVTVNYHNKQYDVSLADKITWYYCGFQIETLVMNIQTNVQGDMELLFDYNTDKLTPDDITGINSLMTAMMDSIFENEDIRVNQLPLASNQDIEMINRINDATDIGNVDGTISSLFENEVLRNASKTAVICQGKSITYKELNEKANQIGHKLQGLGVLPDDRVMILSDRRMELIEGIYGIIKSGGAYVPVDPEYPQERIRSIIDDSRPKAVLTGNISQDHIEMIKKEGIPVISLLDEGTFTGSTENVVNHTKPENLVYMIYTSGTTGKPKGVMIEQRNLVNYCVNDKNNIYPGAIPSDSKMIISTCAPVFDLFNTEIILPLLNDMTVVLPDNDELESGECAARLIIENHVDTMQITPSRMKMYMFDEVFNKTLKKVRTLLFGGESLTDQLTAEVRKYTDSDIFDIYGPSETTVISTMKKVGELNGINNIGNPLTNVQAYVIKDGRMCGVGVYGELCIAGNGVGRGYKNREELTNEKFIKNPFGAGRLYRTGDLARFMSNGEIQYLRRIDSQVKVRGYRIELAEVEGAISKQPGIKAAAASTDEKDGVNFLCGYIASDREINISELKEALKKELPDYMVPTYFMQLPKIPMNKNGKTDRKALPKIEIVSTNEYIAPRNETESILERFFCEILDLKKVSIDEDFFEIGGHSLRATKLVNSIRAEFNINIRSKNIFSNPTIELLAKFIESADKSLVKDEGIPKVEKKELYPASPAQQRMYITEQIGGKTSYNMPEFKLLKGNPDISRIEYAFSEMIRRHEILRTSFIMIQGKAVIKVNDAVEPDFRHTVEIQKPIPLIIKEFIRPFDMSSPSLIRMQVTECAAGVLLLTDIHHSVCDGESYQIFNKEFTAIYNGQELPEVKVQFNDYYDWISHRDLSKHHEYWMNEFSQKVESLDIHTDFPRPENMVVSEGDAVRRPLETELSEKIGRFSSQSGCTEYMIMLSAYMIMLSKYSDKEDLVVATPVSGRIHKDIENIIGMVSNTLAMRGRPCKTKKYIDFLNEIKVKTIRSSEYQEYPIGRLVQEVCIERGQRISEVDEGRIKNNIQQKPHPLFDVIFGFENYDTAEIQMNGVICQPLNKGAKPLTFDIQMHVYQIKDGLEPAMMYSKALFKRETAEKMFDDFCTILEKITENSEQTIGEIIK